MDIQDDMLITYLLGEASPEEIAQVNEWREKDAACNKRFEEFRLLWTTSKGLADTEEETDVYAALQRFKEKARIRKETSVRIRKLKQRNTWMSIAAGLLLVAGFSWLFFSVYGVTAKELATSTSTAVATLPDGSVITLNRQSLLEYPSKFEGNLRRVSLKSGEAFFNIAHNKAKPFVISAGSTLIRVVGTSFNVRNKNNNVEVIVETGIVQVSRNGQTVMLKPGEKVFIEQNSKTLKKNNNPDQLYTYYRSREFVAVNTPLRRVVEVLNEAYDSHIVIERKELNDLPLNTTFKNESLDNILEVISRTFKITIEKKNGNIILK